MSDKLPLQMERDMMGRLLLRGPDGIQTPVRPVRLFPLSCPDGYVLLLDEEEREVSLVRDLADLDVGSRQALQEELELVYLAPEILAIHDIQEEFGVLHWYARTDRGERHFDIRGRDEVVPIAPGHLLIRDIDGNRYEIRDVLALDRHSQALLDVHL